MSPVELVAAGIALALTLAVGTVVHELSHALTLRAVGVPFEIVWLPNADDGFHTILFGALASVRPRQSEATPLWGLRVAAVMPLLLALPVGLVLAGVLPDPVAAGQPVGTAVIVGWLACALPSPQDFSVCWYADRAVDTTDGSE